MLLCSPESFYYAVEGYFDKKDELILLARNIANFASVGFVKPEEFNSSWPLPERMQMKTELTAPSWTATPKETREKIIAHLKQAELKK